MNKVKVFKLINGEELISEVFNTYEGQYELKNPANIMLQQTGNGQMGVGIAPYMPYADGNVKLNWTAIASEAEPEQSMINEYNRIFGAGIQVVGAGALAGL
jgi:hypothetical protein